MCVDNTPSFTPSPRLPASFSSIPLSLCGQRKIQQKGKVQFTVRHIHTIPWLQVYKLTWASVFTLAGFSKNMNLESACTLKFHWFSFKYSFIANVSNRDLQILINRKSIIQSLQTLTTTVWLLSSPGNQD